jgi:Tol biopolymer transport system component
MSLQSGAFIGSYRVSTQLGAGGMGEVYRATDTKLGREVAIKVLPDAFALDVDRLARIEREARALAALNHPNVAHIYGLEEAGGSHALVMELVDGPTLADRIVQSAIPLDEALAIANQVASALEAAHSQGIIHRDLKPANIKLRDDGTIKVLDFGLAKAVEYSGGGGSSLSLSPTVTTPALTQMGVILGTAAYMSPEQVRGKSVDRRADIWAFGCVLFEMLTGRRPFEGEGVTDTLGAILHKEPNWEELDAKVPARIRMVLQRCLHKDPRQRLHDIADVTLAMAGAFETPPAASDRASARVSTTGLRWRYALIGLAGIVIGGLVAAGVMWARDSAPPAAAPIRVALNTPDDPPVRLGNNAADVAITPDGTHVVYGASSEKGGLAVRGLGQLQMAVLATDQQAFQPFVSPDGAWVAFNDQNDRTIKKISINGGPAITLTASASPLRGASWGDDGYIVFATSGPGGLFRLPDGGGQPQEITKPDATKGEVDHEWPYVLPGSRAVLFTRQLQISGAARSEIAVLDLSTQQQRVLIPEGTSPQYARSGHIVYGVNGTLRAVAFDLNTLQVRGNPVPVLESVLTKSSGAVDFSLAANGSLVYMMGAASVEKGRPVWLSRDGAEVGAVVSADITAAAYPRLSPDGRHVAMVVGGDVWVYDVNGSPPIRITFDRGNYSPIWTADSRRLVYEASQPAGAVFSIAADGGEQKPQQISAAGHFHPIALLPNGREMLAVDVGSQTTNTDIVRWQIGQNDAREAVVQTPAREGFEGYALSPDGRWLAYTSNQTGQLEIWVRPYPGPGAPVRVSPNGGIEPVWAKRGQELYYLEETRLMAAAVVPGATLAFKTPTPLFEPAMQVTSQPPSYDVAADGRFLVIRPAATKTRTSTQVVVVTNWLDELRRLVPGP